MTRLSFSFVLRSQILQLFIVMHNSEMGFCVKLLQRFCNGQEGNVVFKMLEKIDNIHFHNHRLRLYSSGEINVARVRDRNLAKQQLNQNEVFLFAFTRVSWTNKFSVFLGKHFHKMFYYAVVTIHNFYETRKSDDGDLCVSELRNKLILVSSYVVGAK